MMQKNLFIKILKCKQNKMLFIIGIQQKMKR